MPHSCSALNCKTGYRSNPTPPGVALFSFPKDPDLLKLWMKNLRREGAFVPTKNTKVCSLHFASTDIQEESRDKKPSRKRQRLEESEGSSRLKRKKLKPGAIPRYFKDLPAYLKQPSPKKRLSTVKKTTAEGRRQLMEDDHEVHVEEFLNEDVISSVHEIMEKLKQEPTLPKGFHMVLDDEDNLLIYSVQLNASDSPVISGSITINDTLAITLAVKGKRIPADRYNDLVPGRIGTLSQVVNMMALLKNWMEKPTDVPWLDMAVDCLEAAVKHGGDDSVMRKVEFSLEQLRLCRLAKTRRRYSPAMMLFCYSVHAASAQAYDQLRSQGVLTCPHSNTIKAITYRLARPEQKDSSVAYLKTRFERLQVWERNVIVMMDEIYVAKRAEYLGTAGRLTGLTPEQSLASTVLCFMVSSVAGKYRDVVALYPISSLNADKLRVALLEVLTMLDKIGFNVIGIVSDNLAVNRRCFTQHLCGGYLKSSVENPAVKGAPLHILFDSTHNIKNIYNNWQRKKLFRLPGNKTANFHHLEELFALARSQPLRMAHKLNLNVFDPSSISKTSTKLALAIFCESTSTALKWYADHGHPEWAQTADFIDYIVTYWNTVNVKTPSAGMRKRDANREPVSADQERQLQVLTQFASYLTEWDLLTRADGGKNGLSVETFLALRQTSLALCAVARHCLTVLGFKYVLLGQFQSDPIESRFGWYRQMNGGNYYLSCQQLFNNERKIRAISLLRYSKLSVSELANISADDSDRTEKFQAEIERAAVTLTSKLEERLLIPDIVDEADANVMNYVAGAVCRTTVRRFKNCADCQTLLFEQGAAADRPLALQADDMDLTPDVRSFIHAVNRGGLKMPTALAFSVALKSWQVFQCINADADLRKLFLSVTNLKALFTTILLRLLEDDSEVEEIVVSRLLCVSGHHSVQDFLGRFFNCIAKNFVRDISVVSPSKHSRKITKLTSSH